MNIKKKLSYALVGRTLLMLLFCSLPYIVKAQVDPGGDPDGVPIDGGVSLLVAAGVGYGAKKLNDLKKKKEENK